MTIQALHQLFLKSSGVSTDTRSIQSGNLFFALKGENFNGNKFTQKALSAGASFTIVEEFFDSKNEQIILVENVLQTLQDLANFHRNYLNIPIIGLTGSNGKTTTKELINAVLSEQFKTHATKGNFNNHIGVPLTLLEMNQSTEIGIVEMGANHIGEIAELCRIANPNYGYITNFGKAHLEGFGSEEGVIKGKSELFQYIKNNHGVIFVNSDDPKQIKQLGGYENFITFSKLKGLGFQIEFVTEQPFLEVKFDNQILTTQLIGHYNFSNVAAAIAIGKYFDVNFSSIKKGIESYIPSNNRSQIIDQNSNTIVMDAYNANPSSMSVALYNFNVMNGENKIVILGDMFELGDRSSDEHKYIIEMALDMKFCEVYFVGNHFFSHASDYPKGLFYDSLEKVISQLNKKKYKNTLILIKGSRGMALERLLVNL